MNELQTFDVLIAAAIDQSPRLLGFVRAEDTPHWRLLVADDSVIDVSIGDGDLLSISTVLGPLGPAQNSDRLNELMLRYLGFHPATSFSIDPDGARRLLQVLPTHALREGQFKDPLEHFASKALAWRDLLRMPSTDLASERASGLGFGLRA